MKAVKVGVEAEAALDALIAEGDFAGVMELTEATAAEQPFAEEVEALFRARVAKQWPRGDAGRRVAAIWERVRAKAEAELAFSRPDLQSGGESKVVEVVPEPKRVQRFNRKIGEAPQIEARKVEGDGEGDGEVADALQSAIAKLGEERRAEPEAGETAEVERRVMLPVVVPPGTAGSEVPLPVVAAELDAVEKLNFKHAVIANYGGKCLVLSWDPWTINKRVLVPTFQAFETFKHRYCHKSVAVGRAETPSKYQLASSG